MTSYFLVCRSARNIEYFYWHSQMQQGVYGEKWVGRQGAGEGVYGERLEGREGRCGGWEGGRKGNGPNLVPSVLYSLTYTAIWNKRFLMKNIFFQFTKKSQPSLSFRKKIGWDSVPYLLWAFLEATFYLKPNRDLICHQSQLPASCNLGLGSKLAL